MVSADHSTTRTFGERLIEALEYQGITDPEQQAERVAKACKVTTRTARKYLQAVSFPAFLSSDSSRFFSLADDLEADSTWLFCGKSFPQESQVAREMRSMSEWEKSKFVRYVMRIRNNGPKAIRLSAMCGAGQISRQQLLAAM